MTDSTLTKDQALALLRKLATDDDFRTRFENKPAKALTEVGLTAESIIELKACCLKPTKLAEKEHFAGIVEALNQAALQEAMSMIIPQMKLSCE